MATSYSGATPKHLWIVGILSLLWNGFGAYDYVMTHMGGSEYFESMGLDGEAYAWFQALPGWSIAAWAVGVWVSVLGAILLLMRNTPRPRSWFRSSARWSASAISSRASGRPLSMAARP